jgi:ribosomal protein L7Ae-like RNA K-turn-binding protein
VNKILSTLGMCACARKISYGETLLKEIKSNKVYFVVVASDASDNSKKRIIDKCTYYKCEYAICLDKDSITKSIGRVDLVSAVGIKDYNLVKKLKENIEREGGSSEEKQ